MCVNNKHLLVNKELCKMCLSFAIYIFRQFQFALNKDNEWDKEKFLIIRTPGEYAGGLALCNLLCWLWVEWIFSAFFEANGLSVRCNMSHKHNRSVYSTATSVSHRCVTCHVMPEHMLIVRVKRYRYVKIVSAHTHVSKLSLCMVCMFKQRKYRRVFSSSVFFHP